jgi:thioesterase domain-containing protein
MRIEDLLYEDVSHFPDFRLELMKIHYQELIQFVPDQITAQADLFRLKRQPLLSRPSQGLGWEQLVEQLDVYDLDGTHITLLDEPYVEKLAEQMDRALKMRTP